MGAITVFYLLSEKGRKASLKAGGDGHEVQSIIVEEPTSELIDLAKIGSDGKGELWVGCEKPYRSGVEPDSIILEYTIDKYRGGEPYVYKNKGRHFWNSPQDVERLLAWQKSYASLLEKSRAKVEKEVEKAHKEWEAERAKKKAEEEAEAARKKAETEAKAAAEAEKKAKMETEAAEWVQTNGSDRLKMILQEGLLENSWRVYQEERLVAELPGWEFWNDLPGEKKEILNPSLAVLQAFQAEKDKVDSPELVFYYVEHRHTDECYNDDEECPKYDESGPIILGIFRPLNKWVAKKLYE